MEVLLSHFGRFAPTAFQARDENPTQAPELRAQSIALLVFDLVICLVLLGFTLAWALYHRKIRTADGTENKKSFKAVMFYYILLTAGYFVQFILEIAPSAVTLSTGSMVGVAISGSILQLVVNDLQAWLMLLFAMGFAIVFNYEGQKKKLIIWATLVYSLVPILSYIITITLIFAMQNRGVAIGGLIFIVLASLGALAFYIFAFIRLSRQTVDHLPNLGVAQHRKAAFLKLFKVFRVMGIIAVSMPLIVGGIALGIGLLAAYQWVGVGTMVFFAVALPIIAKVYVVVFAAIIFFTFRLRSGEDLRFLDGVETYASTTDNEYSDTNYSMNNSDF